MALNNNHSLTPIDLLPKLYILLQFLHDKILSEVENTEIVLHHTMNVIIVFVKFEICGIHLNAIFSLIIDFIKKLLTYINKLGIIVTIKIRFQ